MKVLVINTGSSSLKYRLFEMDGEKVLAQGLIEKIGEPGEKCRDHREAMAMMAGIIDGAGIEAVGHRVVHGGEAFRAPAVIDEKVIEAIRACSPLAPLHNPPNLIGIEAARESFPRAKHVAVFDTAFHQTLPGWAYTYALPTEFLGNHHVRRYGFHGTSHQHAAKQAARMLDRPLDSLNLITVHLGNGSSITAIERGRSIDTSMGMTPLEGLMMGTRGGDLDPGVILHLASGLGLPIDRIAKILNHESGLKAFTQTNDMREVLAKRDAGDPGARLAVSIYTYRIKKYLGAYLAALGRVDAIVFTGGIGENSPSIRSESLSGLENLGIILSPQKNDTVPSPADITAHSSPVKVLVIPANEELEIARQVVEVVAG